MSIPEFAPVIDRDLTDVPAADVILTAFLTSTPVPEEWTQPSLIVFVDDEAIAATRASVLDTAPEATVVSVASEAVEAEIAATYRNSRTLEVALELEPPAGAPKAQLRVTASDSDLAAIQSMLEADSENWHFETPAEFVALGNRQAGLRLVPLLAEIEPLLQELASEPSPLGPAAQALIDLDVGSMAEVEAIRPQADILVSFALDECEVDLQ